MKKTLMIIGGIAIVGVLLFTGMVFEAGYLDGQQKTKDAQTLSYVNDIKAERDDYNSAEKICVSAVTDAVNGDTANYSVKEGEINVLMNEVNQIESKYNTQTK